MKYFDIMDKDEKSVFMSFTDKDDAEKYLDKEKTHFPERCNRYGWHIVEKERLTLFDRNNNAFVIANNAIHSNDESKYLRALREICMMLKPLVSYDEIGNKYLEE